MSQLVCSRSKPLNGKFHEAMLAQRRINVIQGHVKFNLDVMTIELEVTCPTREHGLLFSLCVLDSSFREPQGLSNLTSLAR